MYESRKPNDNATLTISIQTLLVVIQNLFPNMWVRGMIFEKQYDQRPTF